MGHGRPPGGEAVKRDGVRIAGAGPAGLCAALLLARAGLSVELREKRSHVGHRFEGAVHGIENWSSTAPFSERLAAWGIELGSALRPCHELWLCDRHQLRPIRSPEPLFYLVRRGPDAGSLEAELLRLAVAAGVDVRFGQTFEPGARQFDATGPSSSHRVCAEAGFHFQTRSPDLAAALVDRDATPRGYAYLLVRDGQGSLCAVRFDGQPVPKQQLAECELLLRRHVDVEVSGRQPGAGFGSFRLLGHFGSPGRWAIGEQAGLQDLLWGFGIRRALESAELAARCWLDGTDYALAARRDFAVPDRAAVVNRCLWDATAARALPLYARWLRGQSDVRDALFRATHEQSLHRWLYPLALRRLQRRSTHFGARACGAR
ncbi:MAG TPA: NAD(P)-binding protein [Polyangiaceae bacterium]|nr:NAD(P)-binding protein [Polyangiaceae bacterium]